MINIYHIYCMGNIFDSTVIVLCEDELFQTRFPFKFDSEQNELVKESKAVELIYSYWFFHNIYFWN